MVRWLLVVAALIACRAARRLRDPALGRYAAGRTRERMDVFLGGLLRASFGFAAHTTDRPSGPWSPCSAHWPRID
jgi:hypothetical protein